MLPSDENDLKEYFPDWLKANEAYLLSIMMERGGIAAFRYVWTTAINEVIELEEHKAKESYYVVDETKRNTGSNFADQTDKGQERV